MKKMKRLSIFLLIGILIFSLFAPACGGITQEQGVNAIDAYMQEIRDMDLEYSLVFIEREAEQGKQAIMQAEDKTEIRKIKEDTLNAMKALVLTDEEALAIKQAYSNNDNPSPTIEIAAYFGKYDGQNVAAIKKDIPPIGVHQIAIGPYLFYFWLGTIRVYTNDGYFHLNTAYSTGVINDQDLARIYEDNNYLCDRELPYEYNQE